MTTPTPRQKLPDDPAATFFDELGRRGNEPLLRKVSGRVRFDLVDGARTELVARGRRQGRAHRGARGGSRPTARSAANAAVFEEVVGGRTNAIAAVLRGALECHGDLELMFAIQRIFPAPPRGWDPTAGTRSA